MVLGYRYLTISANYQTEEDEKIEGPWLYGTIAVSLVLAIVFFFVLPALLGKWIDQAFLDSDASLVNLMEGLIRIGLVIFYLWIIGQSKDIRRVFMYHGAEHKTINAFESHDRWKSNPFRNVPCNIPDVGHHSY